MTSAKIFILFGLLALGFLNPSEVAATATDIGTKLSSGRDEAMTDPIISMVTEADQSLNQNHKSMSFNVNNDNYEDFIQRIRDEVNDSVTRGIPTLMPQRPETPENAAWLDIRLVAGEHSITVRLEQSNLYIRGYRRSTDDFFWEFTDTHLIPDSRDLLFSASYSLANGITNTAGVSRGNIPLGGVQLENAIHTLARLERPLGSNAQAAARSLLVVSQMIAEAARIIPIAERISTNYWNREGVTLDSRMVALENGWSRLSTAVLQADRNPNPTTPLPRIPAENPTGVSTYGEALAVLALLLLAHVQRGPTVMMTNVDYGRCLMNLEYVRVNNIDGEDPGNLYGTVRVDDGWYTYTFYDRSSGDYENVGPGGFATLTDSSRSFPVSGADAFTISVDLYDQDTFSHNDNIARGTIVWDRVEEGVTLENYDKHLERVVRGEYGDVTVGYSVLSNALGVTIQVILENGDGESEAEVYGTLRASQVLKGSAGSTPITLFEKSSREYADVRKGKPIPLARTVIAAATSTKLTITADLWDYDDLSQDDGIAQGSVDFTVEPGTQWQYINGQFGQVKVIITCE